MINMKNEYVKNNDVIFSKSLITAIENRLKKKEQVTERHTKIY